MSEVRTAKRGAEVTIIAQSEIPEGSFRYGELVSEKATLAERYPGCWLIGNECSVARERADGENGYEFDTVICVHFISWTEEAAWETLNNITDLPMFLVRPGEEG